MLIAIVGADVLLVAFFRGARNASRADRRLVVAEAQRQLRQKVNQEE
jgi:hypothetical protein